MLFLTNKLIDVYGESLVFNEEKKYGARAYRGTFSVRNYTLEYLREVIDGLDVFVISSIVEPKLSQSKLTDLKRNFLNVALKYDMIAPMETDRYYLMGISAFMMQKQYETHFHIIKKCPKVSTTQLTPLAKIVQDEDTFEYFCDDNAIYELVNREKIADSIKGSDGILKWWPEFENGIVSKETGEFFRRISLTNYLGKAPDQDKILNIFSYFNYSDKRHKGAFLDITSVHNWQDFIGLLEYLSEAKGHTVRRTDLPSKLPFSIDLPEKEQTIEVFDERIFGGEMIDVQPGDVLYARTGLPYKGKGEVVVLRVNKNWLEVEMDEISGLGERRKASIRRRSEYLSIIQKASDKKEREHSFDFHKNGQLAFCL